jgi:hypothetical protein
MCGFTVMMEDITVGWIEDYEEVSKSLIVIIRVGLLNFTGLVCIQPMCL